ncbi:hypothetical protein JVU11DRAFT_1107 [Chiua virens]|nr:hypothetical protein JVU11DRAFT_1107 [Chiua virens]
MLHRIINAHARAILEVFQFQLQRGPTRNVFSPEGKVILDSHVDVRTGRMNLQDTGDLAAASRGPRFAIISELW